MQVCVVIIVRSAWLKSARYIWLFFVVGIYMSATFLFVYIIMFRGFFRICDRSLVDIDFCNKVCYNKNKTIDIILCF